MNLYLRPTALWIETVWNRRVQFLDKNLFPMSSGASEWASKRADEWAQRSLRVKWAVWHKRRSSLRANERANKWMAWYSMRWFHSHSSHSAHSPYRWENTNGSYKVLRGPFLPLHCARSPMPCLDLKSIGRPCSFPLLPSLFPLPLSSTSLLCYFFAPLALLPLPPPLALFRYLPCTVFPVSCSSPPSFILLFLIISLSAESRIKRPGNSRNMVEEMSVVIGVAHEMASRLWWTSPLLLLHCRDLHIWHMTHDTWHG